MERWLLALLLGLAAYGVGALRPQIRELRRKIALPEFLGTVHLKAMRFSLDRLSRRWAQVRWGIFFLAGILGAWGICRLLP